MKTFTRVEPTDVVVVGDKFKRDVVVKRFGTEDGLMHEFTTFFSEGSAATAVLAVTEDGDVVATHQFRAGPEEWLWQLPGGGIEQGEDSEQAARRELREETGYEAGTMEYLGACHDDAYLNVKQHVFYATGCRKLREQRPDKTEAEQGMEVGLMTMNELLEKASTGKTCDNGALLMGYLRHVKEGK